MVFTTKQVRELKRDIDPRHVRQREVSGRELSYIEGWHAITEANRIFGFEGWNRETLDTKCVISREQRGRWQALYVIRVRIQVNAKGSLVVREGQGTGQGFAESIGEAHDIAVKTAETDATKRALATFGAPFGLTLYGRGKAEHAADGSGPGPHIGHGESAVQGRPAQKRPQTRSARGVALPPDDTTPVPRPSRYYGRRADLVTRDRALPAASFDVKRASTVPPPIAPTAPAMPPAAPTIVPTAPPIRAPANAGRIDKSGLRFGEVRRFRDKAHLRFVASHPCLVCQLGACDAHHLRFAQPYALGMKVSDEFTVPLCRYHHRELHQAGNEITWWHNVQIKPLPIARALWEKSHPVEAVANAEASQDTEHSAPLAPSDEAQVPSSAETGKPESDESQGSHAVAIRSANEAAT